MRRDRPCPVDNCPQHYQTARGMLRHHERAHARHGRYRARVVLPDGGRDRKHERDRVVAAILAGRRPSEQLRATLEENR